VKITLLVVGKLRDPGSRAWADEYLGRIRRWVRCEEVELRDDAELRSRWPKDDEWVVALEVNGQGLTSTAFSAQLERWGSVGKGNITFVIGGAEGIPKGLSEQAKSKLSLSPMTLPHRMARVLLLEQIYRGLSILRHEPYARK